MIAGAELLPVLTPAAMLAPYVSASIVALLVVVTLTLVACTLLDVTLKTGRTHQIRVHLAHSGHPIVGDKLYAHGDAVFLRCIDAPPDDETAALLMLPRHALHAHAIEFAHPATGEPTRIVAPLPPDLTAFCARHAQAASLPAAIDGP